MHDGSYTKNCCYMFQFYCHLVGADKILLILRAKNLPSWKANWFAASQEIPHISRNPKVHYRTHKRPPPVSILGQSNSVNIIASHLLEIHPNIIHPSTRRSTEWAFSLRFPHQDPKHPRRLNHTRHMPSRSHSSRLRAINFICVSTIKTRKQTLIFTYIKYTD